MLNESNPYASPDAEPPTETEPERLRRRWRWCLYIIFGLSAVQGIIDFSLRDSEHFTSAVLITGIPSIVLALLWVSTDARLENVRLGGLMKLGIVFLTVVFIPIYLFKSRGMKRGFLSVALFVAFLVLNLLVNITVHYGVEFIYYGSIADS